MRGDGRIWDRPAFATDRRVYGSLIAITPRAGAGAGPWGMVSARGSGAHRTHGLGRHHRRRTRDVEWDRCGLHALDLRPAPLFSAHRSFLRC
ncbi:hypothetical protein Swit_3579 [Rhizorhabdus wittichii RW1]|uniref:Uncharacterized protein n=1 Tax=Rhizorhabdus wittichii (strain DSM 6014 / CCUG 31198 / JCM 15750 / NBRC 105917 / EY 4224 / RW1) TaxID=392499 RepID=A0A9J9HE04_RHIWR|nr:hypothetical protein Swit_3579 [Rhizorhabdus wittichii RW1]